MNRTGTFIILLLIIVLGATLRLLFLNSNPPAIFRDEAEKGYNTYALLKTSRAIGFRPQQIGPELQSQSVISASSAPAELETHYLPLFINVFGVYTSAIYQYVAAPFVALLSLNTWSIRLPAALVGMATILLLFFLAREIHSATYGLVCAFLLAISPWHIVFCRWAQQGIFLPLFLTAGIFFFVLGIKKRPAWWIPAALCFALGYYAYSAARIFVPLFLLMLVIIFFNDIKRRLPAFAVSAALFLIISLPIFLFFLGTEHAARFRRISILSADLSSGQIIKTFFSNWILHYSPGFLFLKGDPLPRHSLPYFGQLHIFEAPFLLLGILSLIGINKFGRLDHNHKINPSRPEPNTSHQLIHTKDCADLHIRSNFNLLWLTWFVLFPISASLTREGLPHALRCIVALPMMQLITGQGLILFFRRLANNKEHTGSTDLYDPSKRLFAKIKLVIYILLIIIICLTLTGLIYSLFFIYPAWSAPFWQYGIKQALDYLNAQNINPVSVFLSGRITFAPYLLMFYQKFPPTQIIEKGIGGLRYNFLPPYLDINEQWGRFPRGSYLVLYLGELRHQLPEPRIEYVIHYPPARLRPKLPALIIYKK